MADFTITVSNSIRTFGIAPTSKWNAWNWNAFVWGEGGTVDLRTDVVKLISNAVTPTSSDVTQFSIFMTIINSLSALSGPSLERLMDSAGFSYLFVSDTTNAENRSEATWTEDTQSTSTWTSGTAGSDNWS